MHSRAASCLTVVAIFAGLAVAAPSADASAKGHIAKITSAAATSGPSTGGATVVLRGRYFNKIKSVKFGATRARLVRRSSSTKIIVRTPRHAAGAVTIKIRTAAGTSRSSARATYTFVGAPGITAISPAVGATSAGTRVTVTGHDFRGVRTVRFGTAAGSGLRVLSTSRLQITAPAHTGSGSVAIIVHSSYGTSVATPAGRFSYVAPPTVLSIDSPSGATAGGERVFIRGRDLLGATAVRFGDATGTGIRVTSAAGLSVIAPAHAALGSFDVRVVTRYGTSATSAAARYDYVAAPSPTSSTAVAPGPSGYQPLIRDSACTDVTCFAVGSYTTEVAEIPVIETLSGDTWSWSYAPLPADKLTPLDARLSSVSCTGAQCVAVGEYVDENGYLQSLVETLRDGTWSAAKLKAPSTARGSYLSRVECVSAGSCVATGRAPDGTVLAVFDGSSWIRNYAPVPAGLDPKKVDASSAACGSPTLCVVTALYTGSAAGIQIVTETFDGFAWTSTLLALPTSAVGALITGVSCPSATQCIAAGQTDYAEGPSQPLVASFAHGTWTTSVASMPGDYVKASDTVNRLTSIACKQDRCTATGDYNSAVGHRSMTLTFEHGGWSASAGPDPATDAYRFLASTACVNGRNCMTVGRDTPSTGPAIPTALVRGPGGAATVAVALPDGVTGTEMTLGQVSCSSTGKCVASGRVQTSPSQAVLVVFDGVV